MAPVRTRAFQTAGILSMLTLRLYLESDLGAIAGLNMYSTRAAAFAEASETIAVLLATHATLAVGRARRVTKLPTCSSR